MDNSLGTSGWNADLQRRGQGVSAPVPTNNRGWLNNTLGSVASAVGGVLAAPVHAMANSITGDMADQDYADAHNGQFPASKEERDAWISYNQSNPQNKAGALDTKPQPEQAPQDQAAARASESDAQAQAGMQEGKDIQAKGGAVPPDASNPEAVLQAQNTNKIRGVGDSAGNVQLTTPKPPTMQEQQNAQLVQAGKQAAFDQNKIPVWYKSQSFNMGLISFGLNLLSGNDLATSFGAAANAFDNMYGKETRSAYADELQQHGYSPQEIMEWVQSGKSNVLTDPQEKAQKAALGQAQVQSAQANARLANFQASPDYQNYQMQRQQNEDQFNQAYRMNQLQGQQFNQKMALENLDLRKQELGIKQAKANQEAATQFGIDPKVARNLTGQFNSDNAVTRIKINNLNDAYHTLDNMETLMKQGKTAEAAKLWQTASEVYTRGMVQGRGVINQSTIDKTTAPTDYMGQAENWISRKFNGVPDLASIQRLKNNALQGIQDRQKTAQENMEVGVQALMQAGYSEDQARKYINFSNAGLGVSGANFSTVPANSSTVKIKRVP